MVKYIEHTLWQEQIDSEKSVPLKYYTVSKEYLKTWGNK